MAEITINNDVTLYAAGNILVEKTMKTSKAGKSYPSLSIKKSYLGADGKPKTSGYFFPSEIEALVNLLKEVEEDNKSFIFKPKNN